MGVIDCIVMWVLHRMYTKCNKPILYIKGTGADYPKYLLYTEDVNVYQRMDDF